MPSLKTKRSYTAFSVRAIIQAVSRLTHTAEYWVQSCGQSGTWIGLPPSTSILSVITIPPVHASHMLIYHRRYIILEIDTIVK